MSYFKGALDALNDLFGVIFARLDALGDRTEALEKDLEGLKSRELDEGPCDSEDIKDDLIRLADSVANRELEARDYFCRVESLEDQIETYDGYWSHFEPKINHLEDELKDALSRDNGLSARLDSLDNEIGEMNASLLTIRSYQFVEPSELEAVQDEVRALKDSVKFQTSVIAEQAKIIRKLCEALEWTPPLD